MRTITGLATARGFAIGPVFVYRGDGNVPIPEYVVDPGREADELVRLKRAVMETRRDLDLMIATLRERAGQADVRIFECHQMLLEDVVLYGEAEKLIIEDRVNAESAVRRTAANARRQFERMNDT